MQPDILNIGLGFLEGFALIISPCILPILPIIFAGSLTGSKKRPFGIIIGFVLIFALFTYFSRKLVQLTGIDLNLIRHISFGILLLLGFIMLSTYLTEKFTQLTQRLSNAGSSLSSVNNPQGGLISGILFGGLVAIIWTPCAGPILAAVIVQTVIQQTNFMSFLMLLAFGLGAGIPMLLIALFGRIIMTKLSYFKTHTNAFRKALGLIIILTVACMIYFENGISTAHAAEVNNAKTAPATYTLDPMHSYVQWHINHFGFSNPSGKWFADGTLVLDEAKPQNSKLNVVIHIDKIVTGIPELDKHLLSPLFFDVAKFPTATFVSNKIALTSKNTANVTGILTVHGISKPVTLNVALNKLGVNPINNKMSVGFSATTKILRSDFGINTLLPGLGDEVVLNIQSEASQ